MVFRQGYANHSFCAPSRAALMSGRYPYRFGFETNPAYDPANPLMGIDEGEKLFPKRLQEVGYKTAVIGKWHLGASEKHHPLNRGFDHFYGFLGGGHDYFKIDETKTVKEAYKQPLNRNKKSANFEGYLTTALSRNGVQFIEDNKDNPFFLFMSYNAPHSPLQAPKEDIARYSHITNKKRRVYAAMVDVMDRGIGEVLSALKKNNLYDDTLIFFLSDNGGPQPTKKHPHSGNASSNGKFRGGKGTFYDGGVHVPFVAHWPNGLPSGVVYNFPVHSLDISRTAVEVAGGNSSDVTQMEGVNLIPYVIKNKKKDYPHEALYWSGGNGRKWSILSYDGVKHIMNRDSKEPKLFSLKEDVSESTNIVDKYPKRAKELRNQWEVWSQNNVRSKMLGYKQYHKLRTEFFKTAVPK